MGRPRPPTPYGSVLVGIELACARHRHSDGLERVHDSNRAGVVLEHLRQALVGLRRLVGVSSAKDDAAPAEPTLHVLARDAARVGGIVDPAAAELLASATSRGAAHHATGSVHRGEQRRLLVEGRGQWVAAELDALEDHRVIAHASTDESALPAERRGCALADDPDVLARVVLLPREVVMVVDLVELARAEDPDHAVADPVATCVGVTAGSGHRGHG